MKVELELNESELEQLYYTVRSERNRYIDNIADMEKLGYPETNNTTKQMYNNNCKWEKVYKRIEHDIEKYLDK